MTDTNTCAWDPATSTATCGAAEEQTAQRAKMTTYKEIAAHENLLSSQTFGRLIKAGYSHDIERKMKILQKQGFIYDAELSSKKVTVAYDPTTKHAVVIFKGTDPSNVSDVWTDLHILGGTRPEQLSRVQHSREIIRMTREKYGDGNVIAAGHSLGGYLAQHSGADHVMTFNKLSVGDDKETLAEYQTDFRNRSDIASLMQDKGASTGEHQHTIEVKGGKWYLPISTHKRFTPLMRADKEGVEKKDRHFLEHLAIGSAHLARAPLYAATTLSDLAVNRAETAIQNAATSLGTLSGSLIGGLAGPAGVPIGGAVGALVGNKIARTVNTKISQAYKKYKDPNKTVHRAKRRHKK